MLELSLHTIWWIPVYILASGLLGLFWVPGGLRKTGPRPVGYLNLLASATGFLHSLGTLVCIWGQPAHELSFSWVKVADLNLVVSIEVSVVTLGAIVVVTGLNVLAQLYAVGYLEMDWGWARFFAAVSLFESGMCALALCNSLFFSYVILEILTLGTYLLIGIWFNQSLVVTGARDAFLTKRVGDLVLLVGVVALWPLTGTWNYAELATWAESATVTPAVAAALGLAMLAGPMGKCAQFPLHLWLDEAMEGPLPASILRNSVVVATGAWVLIKLQPVLALSPVVMAAMIWVGAVTAVGATLIAIAQIDLKRALSYLVSAYMGLVFVAVGTQQTTAALLLLLTYALAMALLVMGIGTIVIGNITQDLTQLGGLWSRRPIIGLAFLTGSAGLIAVPPLGGFWALLQLVDGLWQQQPWLVGLVLGVNGLTAFGLARVFCLIFGGKPQLMTVRSPEVLWPMVVPTVVLTGVVLHLPLILSQLSLLPAWAELNKDVALMLTWSSLFGWGLGAAVYLGKMWPKPIRLPLPGLQAFFANDLYTAQLYRSTIVLGVGLISRIIDWFDRYFVDGAVNLVGVVTLLSGQTLRYNTSGQAQFYMLSILMGVALMGLWFCWPLLS